MEKFILDVQLLNDEGLSAPVALPAIDVTDNGFVARWEKDFSGSFLFVLAEDVNFSRSVDSYDAVMLEDTSLVVSGLSSGTSYYYKVFAIFGNLVSDESNIIEVTTL